MVGEKKPISRGVFRYNGPCGCQDGHCAVRKSVIYIYSIYIYAPPSNRPLKVEHLHIAAFCVTGVLYRATRTSHVHARPVEAPTSRFDSRGCPVHRHLRPRAEEAGRTSSTRLLQLAEVEARAASEGQE